MANEAEFRVKVSGQTNISQILADLRSGISEAKDMGREAMTSIASEPYPESGGAATSHGGARGMTTVSTATGGTAKGEKDMWAGYRTQMDKLGSDLYAAWETMITKFKTQAMEAMRNFPGNMEANVDHDIAWSRLQTDRTQARVTDGRYAVYEGENRAWQRMQEGAVGLSAAAQHRDLVGSMGSVMVGGKEVPLLGTNTLSNLAGIEGQKGRDIDTGSQLAAIKALTDALQKAAAATLSMANAEDLASAQLEQRDLKTAQGLHLERMRAGRGTTPQEVELQNLQDQNRRAQADALQAYRRDNGLPHLGIGGGGSFLQQITGEMHRARGTGGARVNTDMMSGGQFFADHAIRTLGYAVPGIAIGMGFEEMRRAFDESQKAQRSMRELQAEFEGLSQSSQFAGFSSSIKGISSDTGVAVSEVIQLGLAMKGVYGDTAQATIATRGMAEATVTMGVSLQEARADMTAISQSFTDLQSQGGKAQVTIQNQALHLQDVTGVEAKDLLPGTADVASTAATAGFNSYQTMAMIAAAAQHSGLSSATIGETLSKIITGITSNGTTRLGVESLLQGQGLVAKDIQGQSMSAQVQGVIAALPNLTGAMREEVLTGLGLNASALPAANALGLTGKEASNLAKTSVPGDRADQEFKKQMDTLAGRLSQLRTDFVNLGVGILDSGVGQAITDLADAAGVGVKWLGELNSATHGMAGQFLALAAGLAAFKLLQATITTTIKVFEALRASIGLNTLAEEENTASKGLGAAAGVFTGGGGLSAILGRAGIGSGAAASEIGLVPGIGTAVIGGALLGNYLGHQSWNPFKQGNPLYFGDAFAPGPVSPANAVGANATGPGTKVTTTVRGHQVTGHFEDYTVFGDANHKSDYLGSTKYGKQQEAFVANNRGRLAAVENTIQDPKIRRLFQFDLQNAKYDNTYQQLLQLYSQYGQTNAGQAGVKNVNASQKALEQIKNAIEAPIAEAFDALTGRPDAGQKAQKATQKYLQGLHNAIFGGTKGGGDYQAALAGYANDQASGSDTKQAIQNAVDAAKTNFQKTGDPKDFQDWMTKLQSLNQFVQAQAQSILQLAQTADNGSPAGAKAALDAAKNALAQAPTLQDALQAWQGVVSSFQQQMQAAAGQATTPAEVIKAQTQTVTMDPATRKAIADKYYNGDVSKVPDSYTGYMSPQQQYSTLQGGTSAAEQFQATQSQFGAHDPMQAAAAAVAAAQANKDNLTKTGDKYQPDIQQANAALAQANQQLTDATAQQTEAQADMYAQIFSNAPLQAAQYTMQKLQAQLKNAHSAAEYSQVSGQISQLNQQIAADTIALGDAMSAQTQATLTAQGNPIGAAQQKYTQDLTDIAARRKLDEQMGVNQSKDTQLQQSIAQSISDQSNVLQTQFSTLQTTTQNELYLGQITGTQAITMLEQGMAAAKGNALLVQQYQVAIRQIQNSAGANLNFDLPQNLLINPTLYQAARVNQLGSTGYNGATVVQVTVNVNNPSNTPGAVNTILNAIGANRSGSIGPVVSTPLAPSGV